MTTLISTLFLAFLVLALITLVLGGICGMANKWKYCTRCQMFWNECGNRTTEPPDRLDVRPEACGCGEQPGSATGRTTQDFMNSENSMPSEPPVRCIRWLGINLRPKTKRRIIDFGVTGVTFATIQIVSGHWWSILIIMPFGFWNFYDGQTRGDLDA